MDRLIFLVILACASSFADDQLVYFRSFQDDNFLTSEGRIVSGWEAKAGQFPHQLALRMVNQNGQVGACGAALIAKEWAMTAAHCHSSQYNLVVRAGLTDTKKPQWMFETSEFYDHPKFVELSPFVQPNDIGLIKFPISLEFNEYIKPIRVQSSLYKDRSYDGEQLMVSGWGRNWTSGVSPEVLHWVYQRGISREQCLEMYGGSHSAIVESTVCAMFWDKESQSICQGDSGGALTIMEKDGERSLIGIASFTHRTGCHTPFPAGFVRPEHFHDWFTEVTGINFDWTPQLIMDDAKDSLT